jgi:hypothetical protein
MMDEIELFSRVYHGIHGGNVGVYTHEDGSTYAGAQEGGNAHGYGVLTYSHGDTRSGQLANGRSHGHAEVHWADGDVYYFLYEHGNLVHTAYVEPNGACFYDGVPCGADQADFAALKAAAQQAGVRACPYPHPTQCPRRTRSGRKPQRVLVFAGLRFFGVDPRLSACACAILRACVRVYAFACACACACVFCVCMWACDCACNCACVCACVLRVCMRLWVCVSARVCAR